MLALRYFLFTSAGESQSSFSTSRNHARSGPSASGNRSQKVRRVLFAITRIRSYNTFPQSLQVMRSQRGNIDPTNVSGAWLLGLQVLEVRRHLWRSGCTPLSAFPSRSPSPVGFLLPPPLPLSSASTPPPCPLSPPPS